MKRHESYRLKRLLDQQAEYAVAFIIRTPHATYGATAKRFGVSINSIRGRIEYRFGSLDAARRANRIDVESKKPGLRDRVSRKRSCLICRETFELEKGTYMCQPCKDKLQRQHDGWV